jgi:hypothetical protein
MEIRTHQNPFNREDAQMPRNDRFVVRHGKKWAVKKAGVEKPEGVYSKQSNAERAAKKTVGELGGGEVRVQGRDRLWRDSDTVPPARDPHPPKDKKH